MGELHRSSVLYPLLCQTVVGSEKAVKTKRLLNNIHDRIISCHRMSVITSGSFGEGLEMKGSDFDIMYVLKSIIIVEDLINLDFDPTKSYFITEMEDTNPGFTKLRLIYSKNAEVLGLCEKFEGTLFLSSNLIKYWIKFFWLSNIDITHGPCISDKSGEVDLASCVRCKSWILPAKRWITRSNNGWPSDDVKASIIDHGVLFVPIGICGSPSEELEWRISFSVGEKLLIYSFNHTQFLCYTLLKVLLKHIDVRCKGLLCSYFMKTIIFWISEESDVSIWEPEKLVECFRRCFRRLIYCVRHISCPHYFIPDNNLFERKLSGSERYILLSNLNTLYERWLPFSEQSVQFHSTSDKMHRDYFDNEECVLTTLYNSVALSGKDFNNTASSYDKGIRYLLRCSSPKLKELYMIRLLRLYTGLKMENPFMYRQNKKYYKSYKTIQSFILQNTYENAVTGWMFLSSLFYKMNQYEKALFILSYVLPKCTPEKFCVGKIKQLSNIQWKLLSNKTIKSMSLAKQLRVFFLHALCFNKDTNICLIPKELFSHCKAAQFFLISPVVYGHFLSLLCHFHLGNIHRCRLSLMDLQLTIKENYLIPSSFSKAFSYICLGVALKLLGNNAAAKEVFLESVMTYPLPVIKTLVHLELGKSS